MSNTRKESPRSQMVGLRRTPCSKVTELKASSAHECKCCKVWPMDVVLQVGYTLWNQFQQKNRKLVSTRSL